MVFSPLRFPDVRDVSELWAATTAISGRSLNRRDKGGATTALVAPKFGLKSAV